MTHTQTQMGVEPAAKNTLVGVGGSLSQVTGPSSHPSHCRSWREPRPSHLEVFSHSFHPPTPPRTPAHLMSRAKFILKLKPGEAQSWHCGGMIRVQGPLSPITPTALGRLNFQH